MIAANHNRCFEFAFLDQIVHRQPELRTLTITQPADTRRQSLELDALARQFDPAAQNAIPRKHLQYQIVSDGNISGIAGERYPSERAAAFAEERTDVRRNKTGKIIGVFHALLKSKRPDVV